MLILFLMIKWPKSVVSSSRMTNQFFRVTHLNGYSISLFGCLIGSSIINKFRTEILVQPQLKICPTSKLLLLLDFLTHCQWYPDDHTTNMKEKKWFHKPINCTFSSFLTCLYVLQLCTSMPKGKKWLYFSHVSQIWPFPLNTDHLVHYHPVSPEIL